MGFFLTIALVAAAIFAFLEYRRGTTYARGYECTKKHHSSCLPMIGLREARMISMGPLLRLIWQPVLLLMHLFRSW